MKKITSGQWWIKGLCLGTLAMLVLWTAAGGSNIVDHAAAEVERLLAAHQPRQLDEKRVAELDRYVEIARKRSLEDFEAAEWEG